MMRPTTIKQVAALPYRDGLAGLRVLLVTSRETRRWVLPKGNRVRGLAPHQAAAHEAFEEAGVTGVAAPDAIGRYAYTKRHEGGGRVARVEVFPLAVTTRSTDWPEAGQRDRRWFTLAGAAAAVEEPELSAIIAGFAPVRHRLRPRAWVGLVVIAGAAALRWWHGGGGV